jgi:predicted  nucleic acid-binding Zn-ribbon protein
MLNETQSLVRLHELEFGLDGNAGFLSERTEVEIKRCRAEMSPALLARYEQLKLRYSEEAVMEMDGNICTGCRISLPKNQVDKLKRGVVSCDHCGRFLYDPDTVYSMR